MATPDDWFDDRLTAHLVAHQEQIDQADRALVHLPDATLLPPDAQAKLARVKNCLDILSALGGVANGHSPSDPPAGPQPAQPRRIGRFHILEELGCGGFGIVYRAWDPRIDREVALKIPRFEVLASTELRQRFEHEAQAAARLDHPNIIAVLEAGVDGVLPYIASVYYAGQTLGDWLKSVAVKTTPRQAAQLIQQLALAVAHAHGRNVLHRDIKPSNVLLVPPTGVATNEFTLDQATPKLMDFGLAKLADAAGQMTQTGALLGTIRYMSPEQAAGRVSEMGPACDVYGLGAMLYELLTGGAPFAADSDLEVLRRIQDDEPATVRSWQRDVPRDLETICLKCLEKSPARRYPTAHLLAADLGRFLDGQPIHARPVSLWERTAKWVRRYPAWAGLFAVTTLATIGLVVGLAWSNQNIRAERNKAIESQQATARQERIAREYAYCADMRLAQEAWDRSTPTEAISLLERYLPQTGEADLRGIEWHYLWDNAHRYSQVIASQPTPVFSLAVSPNEKQFVTGGRDRKLRVWSRETPRLLHELHGDDVGDINAILFSPDGKTAYTAGDDQRIKIWRTDDWQLQGTLKGHHGWIGALALSADGQWLASGDAEGRVLLWHTPMRELKHEMYRHQGAVKCLLMRPKATWLASFCDQGECRIWDYQSNQAPAEFPQGSFEGPPDGVRHAAFHPNGDWLYGSSAGLVVWDFRGNRGKLHGQRYQPWGDAIAISPHGQWILSGGGVANPDIFVRREDASDQLTAALHGHSHFIRAVVPLTDEQTALSGSDDGTVRAWQYHNVYPTNFSRYVGSRVDALAWSPANDVLLIGLHGGEVVITQAPYQTDKSLGRHKHSPRAFAFASDGRRFMSIDEQGEVRWGDTTNGLQEPAFQVAPDISQASLDHTDSFLLYIQANDLVVVEATTGSERWRFEHPVAVTGLQLARDEVFTACNDGCLRCFELTTGKLRREAPSRRGFLHSIDQSPAGGRLLLSYQDKTLHILDSSSLQQIVSVAHTETRRAFFVDNDRRLLAINDQGLALLHSQNGHALLKWDENADWRVMAMNCDRTVLAARAVPDHLVIVRLRGE